MTRFFARLLVLTVASALAALALSGPAQAAAAPYCGITWGSLAKQGPTTFPVPGASLTDVRGGRHECWDRLVLDIPGTRTMGTWRVEYVPQVIMDPSGEPVPLRGGAFLQISVGAPAYDSHGHSTYNPPNRKELGDVTGYRTFRQVSWAGSFEGVTGIGLGVRTRLPFRAFTLPGPTGSATQVIVDVAHAW